MAYTIRDEDLPAVITALREKAERSRKEAVRLRQRKFSTIPLAYDADAAFLTALADEIQGGE